MTYFAVGFVVGFMFFVLLAAVANLLTHCPATGRKHEWMYYGPTEQAGHAKYWDRMCLKCGLYD